MSDLERAAAEHLRAQREVSAREARLDAEAQQATARGEEALRRQAQEFFNLARRYGAPLFQRYVQLNYPSVPVYKRTDDQCVTAAGWQPGQTAGHFTEPRWAVSSDGTVYPSVSVRTVTSPEERIRDDRSVIIGNAARIVSSHVDFTPHFVAAAAALMESVWVAPGQQTGIQADGCIGYRI